MLLTKENVKKITSADIEKPEPDMFHLPEKVLLFGTGVLLRGLPNYFIDKANRNGIFNGRTVMVKSTSQGSLDDDERQDFLYTLCIRGLANQKEVRENSINSSVSRIINAATQWQQVLDCAANKDLSIIISNTTEVGIRFVAESIGQTPPQSYPAKLLAFLYERYKVFAGSAGSGCIIIPTELINNNGNALKAIVNDLANFNQLEGDFITWLNHHNRFCNSLVDRIVPGKMNEEAQRAFEQETAYEDKLAIMAEPYALWAIEGDERIQEALSFCRADGRIIITGDIEKYRELKLRLLNGTHTFSCALAYLKGIRTVKEAMQDEEMNRFIKNLMHDEISPAISYAVSKEEKEQFADDVADRFANPFIEHQWLSISMNYTAKMKMRNVPLIVHYITEYKQVPRLMALGFAAFLRFMQPMKKEGGIWYGKHNGTGYKISDEQAVYFHETWLQTNTEQAINTILSNEDLWGIDLTQSEGFAAAVIHQFNHLPA